MAISDDPAAFVPFTKAERIQQLGDIDKKIVSLLRSSGQAVQCLGKKESNDEDTIMTDSGPPTQQFKESMEEFLRTLRSVNVGLKRQIWGLEEAGIISTGKKNANTNSGRSRLLEPDGSGKIGGLDVGWLNSRSNKVEKEMEGDLWKELEDILGRLIESQQQEANSTANVG
ncbi:hypothetical protein GGS20DRAFT_372704 [Poronia punctata]|nr:hypothetical protein GGS20DRAFT_372704 [Poronia punctata]